MVLAGGQKAGLRAYIKTVICGLQKVYMGGLMGFPWKNRLQVGFHDLPMKGQLQVASIKEKKKSKGI